MPQLSLAQHMQPGPPALGRYVAEYTAAESVSPKVSGAMFHPVVELHVQRVKGPCEQFFDNG